MNDLDDIPEDVLEKMDLFRAIIRALLAMSETGMIEIPINIPNEPCCFAYRKEHIENGTVIRFRAVPHAGKTH